MKDIALQKAAGAGDKALNLLREYVQNEILFILQRTGLDAGLLFVGGTALRFLYGIGRFSEDLDFCSGPGWRKDSLSSLAGRLESELRKSGYAVESAFKAEKTVQRVFVRFPGLLQEAGLSGRVSEKLAIHIEIDSDPSPGWLDERTIVNLHMPVLLRHYDKASLFASKILAFVNRPYAKGRDVYDLIWMKSKWRDLMPNLALLNNGLKKARSHFRPLDDASWPAVVRTRGEALDWSMIVRDIRPFLEDPRAADLLTLDSLRALYGGRADK